LSTAGLLFENISSGVVVNIWATGLGAYSVKSYNPSLLPGNPVLTSSAQFAVVTPEPATLTLAGIGLIGLIGYSLRRRKLNPAAV